MELGQIAGKHDADLVGENLLALIVDDPAAVAVAVETEANIGAALLDRRRHGMQHLHVFRIRIVVGEGVVELGIERDDIDAQSFQNAGCESARRAVAAGDDRLDPALELGDAWSDRRHRCRRKFSTNRYPPPSRAL